MRAKLLYIVHILMHVEPFIFLIEAVCLCVGWWVGSVFLGIITYFFAFNFISLLENLIFHNFL